MVAPATETPRGERSHTVGAHVAEGRGRGFLHWWQHNHCRPQLRPYSTAGSLKFTHHFGLNCFFIFGEQFILQDLVTHSISAPPLLSFPSVLGAAARAAGDKFCGTLWGLGPTVGPLWFAGAPLWFIGAGLIGSSR